jgi:hypothetical protein
MTLLGENKMGLGTKYRAYLRQIEKRKRKNKHSFIS